MFENLRLTKKLLILSMLACFQLTALGQVTLFYNESPQSPPPGSIKYYIDHSDNRTWTRFNTIKQNLEHLPAEILSTSYQDNMTWLVINLDKIPRPDSLSYLMVRNPQLNYLKVWLVKNDSLARDFPITGDRLPFNSRTIDHPDFVFPLPASSWNEYSVVILADKRNEQIAIPIHIFTENGFLTYNLKKTLVIGLIIGLAIFLFIFNLFLYFQMRDRLYVFYGLYILMILLYIFSDYGYSFMYLYPRNPYPADLMRPLTLSLATPLYLLFCLELLEVKKRLPVHYKWMTGALLLYLLIFLLSIPLMPVMGSTRILTQALMQLLLTLLVIGNLVTAYASWRKNNQFGLYIVASSLLLLATGSGYGLYLSGYIPDNLFTRNLMNIGYVGEISLLAFVLSFRFKRYKEQSEELMRRSSLQQEQIFRTVTDYQEKELQRLSSLLHDSVGARLSALRFNLESGRKGSGENGQVKQTIAEINELANEVRQFSHNLSPVLLQKKGLKDAIIHFIEPINETGVLNIQFEMIGSLDHTSFRYELLVYNIIQELVQNILKHSKASEAIIQLLMEPGLISIYAEDNGIGFDSQNMKEGLGFSQVKQLVTFVNGKLMIDSSENKGSRISIEFTAIPDEQTH